MAAANVSLARQVMTARAVGDAPLGKITQLANLLFVLFDAARNRITFNQAIYLHAHLVFALAVHIFTQFTLAASIL